MKYAAVLSALALSMTQVAAFPAAMMHMMAKREAAIPADIEAAIANIHEKRVSGVAPGFDPKLQYVSNQGANAFMAPGPNDQRGPCPGLNAMANHGYLPRNGVATITQFIQQTNAVFGMGLDLGAFLAVYGAVIDGDGTSWSIGGPTAALPGILGLSQPQGISNSHNKYESDVSPTRPDLYEYGNDYKVILSQFENLFARQTDPATANYNLDVLTDFRAYRFAQSVANNPNFFNGPFSGVAVQPAAYTFIYRFMANKSMEHPDGILNQDVLKSFFAITGQPGSFVWNEGQEKIPDNWYKRAIGDEYTIPFFSSDLNAAALKYPQFLSVGGNTGTTNSFTGLDITDLTGGVYNAQTLAQGNNALCLAYQVQLSVTPDLLTGLVSDVTGSTAQLAAAFDKAFGGLGCPKLSKIDKTQFANFPGAKGAY